MIVSDEYLDEILDRYDEVRRKNWDDFFNKHFGKKTMTDINLDTVELKKAEFTANVGDKQITAKVADKAEADKADATKDVPFVA